MHFKKPGAKNSFPIGNNVVPFPTGERVLVSAAFILAP
jgi:hypothetical protein